MPVSDRLSNLPSVEIVDTGRAENYGWYMPQVVGLSPTAPGEYVDVRERLTREYLSLLMSSDCRLYLG